MMKNDRSTYMKAYRAEYKKRVAIVKVTMTNSEFVALKQMAKSEGKRPARLAREFIKAGLYDQPRMPAEITAELTTLRHLIYSVGNNMNLAPVHEVPITLIWSNLFEVKLSCAARTGCPCKKESADTPSVTHLV